MTLSAMLAMLLLMGVIVCTSFGSETKRVAVEGRLDVPVPQGTQGPKLSNIKITLNGDEFTTYTRVDGTFAFYGVPEGIYALDVMSVDIFYPSAKLKIASDGTGSQEPSVNVVEYKYPGAPRQAAVYPIVLRAIAPLGYFQPKPTFSMVGLLMANPMMLIMLVVGGGMVWMMSNIDPEVMKELKEQQKGQDDPMKALQKMTGGLFGAKKDDEDE